MDHAAWAERNWGRKLSPFEARVMNILGIVGNGLYNAPIAKRIHWDYSGPGRGVAVLWRTDLPTYDFDTLTGLVLLCHEARIRLSIDSCNPKYLRLCFWQRQAEGEMVYQRHPSIEQAIEKWKLPEDHMIRWENHAERKGDAQ